MTLTRLYRNGDHWKESRQFGRDDLLQAAKVLDLAPRKPKDHLMVMNMCGRGDKDIFTVAEHLGGKI